MACSLQARCVATSPEYWSGSILRLAHLASAENHLAVRKDADRSLHSTTKWRVELHRMPPELPISHTFVFQTPITKEWLPIRRPSPTTGTSGAIKEIATLT